MAERHGAGAKRGAARPASPWGTVRGRAQQRQLKREAVLLTAARLFNEKGYVASTLDEVAERLNVSKPTVYYYVDSKDQILFECVRTGLEMLKEAIREVDKAGGRAVDKLVAAMRKYVEIVTMDFGMCVIRVGEDPLPPESRRKLRGMKAELDHEFRELIRQGIAEGSIAPCDPKLAAFTLAGALSWIGRWYDPAGELAPDAIADQCIGLLALGLCSGATRPAGARRSTLVAANGVAADPAAHPVAHPVTHPAAHAAAHPAPRRAASPPARKPARAAAPKRGGSRRTS